MAQRVQSNAASAAEPLPSPRTLYKVQLDMALGNQSEAAYVIAGTSKFVSVVGHMVVIRPPDDATDTDAVREAHRSMVDYFGFVHTSRLHRRAWATATLHANSVLNGGRGLFH